MINKVKEDFSKAAKSYDGHAHLQLEIADRLLSRLTFLNFKPRRILDLGCGTGTMLSKLRVLYPEAEVVGVDVALMMCKQAKNNVVCADIHHLPVQSNTFDLVLSNFTLQWCENLKQVFSEVQRVVTPEGLFLFSTVGAASLRELRESWQEVGGSKRVKSFEDMHSVGDALYQTGWQEPVMDVDRITHYYSDVKMMLQEFKQLGVTNKSSDRNKGLMGKATFMAFQEAYEKQRQSQGIPLSWEVVYGYARAPKGVRFGI